MRWHHLRTSDGWSIRDENRLEVARVHNPQHDRECDAKLLADAPRLRERLNCYEPTVSTLRAKLVTEMVAWIRSTSMSLERAQSFYARTARLAKALQRGKESVLAEIEHEARAIVARGEEA